MRLTFTSIAFGGEAVARHEGKAVFVPFAMPGDEAEVELVADHGRFARGRITRLPTPAPERVAPRCKHFGACGGCHWQHIPYALQLQYKTQIVREQLTRLGGLSDPPVRPALGADSPWHYRNHIQFHVDRQGRMGFMAARSHQIIAIEECHILAAPVESLWRELDLALPDLEKVVLRAGVNSGERLAALGLSSDEAPEAEIDLPVNVVVELAGGREIVLAGDDHFHESLNGQSFQVSAASFFQVNTPQAERLMRWLKDWVIEQAQDRGALRVARSRANAQTLNGGAPIARDLTLLDAYCGVGTVALALAPFAQKVVAIESAPSAARDARANARTFSNVQIVEGKVETVLPQLTDNFDAVVLDPPREGCAPAVLDAIIQRRVPRIVYISCDPSTLARDAKRLVAGGYHLVEAQPFDMFPQTFHIETVAVFDSATPDDPASP
ncbi:MAG: class I SAM-dependent RNA methyltransferase [Chloroflexi bacterium]|nr:class I SAM-dependent RNA methyltransferase [Chloroflexota bacterium]